MAETVEFKPLLLAGVIPTSEGSEIRFYADEYRGYSYACLRTFVRRENYAGPTKAGVTMNLPLLEKVLAELDKLPAEPESTEDVELARWPKRAGLELALRITIYRDSTGIDFREWVSDEAYTGWSKKGVRLLYKELGKIREYLKALKEFLEKQPKPKAGKGKGAKDAQEA